MVEKRNTVFTAPARLLCGVLLILLLASFWFLRQDNVLPFRMIRSLITLSCLGAILYPKVRRGGVVIVVFLVLFSMSSFGTVWFENKVWASLSLLLNCAAFSLLIKTIWSKVSFKQLGAILTIALVVFLIVNGYILYNFMDLLKGVTESSFLYITMVLYAASLFLLGFLSLVYNHACNTRPSLIFTASILLFIFSEILRALGYFNFGYGAAPAYIARLLLVIASALLTYYVLLDKNENELIL